MPGADSEKKSKGVGAEELSWLQLLSGLWKFVTPETIEEYSYKTARAKLEKDLELEDGALTPRKQDIKKCLKFIVETFEDAPIKNLEEDEEPSDEGEDASKNSGHAQKKRKVETEEAPRDAAKIQANLMTRGEFEDQADEVLCNLGPSAFKVEPRVFSPNNKGQSNVGWGYYKKIKMPIGKKKVWCAVSMNVIVAGSKDWEEGKRVKINDRQN